MRGFQKIDQKFYEEFDFSYSYEEVPLPKRSTKGSAGYDFYALNDIEIPPKKEEIVYTGVKAYMKKDEVLFIFIRSSVAIKKNITLKNQVGIIDSDYYYSSNGGHIMIVLRNEGKETFKIKKGERIAQGIFLNYLLADGDNTETRRTGGVGSTGYL